MKPQPVILTLLVVVAAVVAVVVVLAVKPKKEESELTTLPPAPADRLDRAKAYLIDNGVSRDEDLNSSTSPQYKALEFMTRTDELQLEIPAGSLADGNEFVTRYSLATFFYATQGTQWWSDTAGFLSPKPVCDWYSVIRTPAMEEEYYGVACENGVPISLNFTRNNLQGSLPAELSFVTSLEHIYMDSNQLGGQIPDSFRRLTNLKDLNLMMNSFVGTLPSWLGSFTGLRSIILSTNYFTGTVPFSFADMENLVDLALDSNLLQGSISEVFDMSAKAGLRRLEHFYMDNNQLTGTLSNNFLAGLHSLRHLDLSENSIQGSVPSHLFELNNLEVLDLHENGFDTLPNEFAENTNLGLLALQKCQFEKSIPSALYNLKGLRHLDLSQNALVGDIPSEIGLMRNLTYLFLAQNNFNPGLIPSWLANLSDLKELCLKSTQLSGSIPASLGELQELILLDLDNNNLTGSIPESLGGLSNLMILLLNRNNLNTSIPKSFSDLKELKVLFIEGNSDVEGSLNDLFCDNPDFIMKPVIVAGCDICEVAKNECCTQCCKEGDQCNPGTFVPDMDPMWLSGYQRVFYAFGRDHFADKDRSKSYPGASSSGYITEEYETLEKLESVSEYRKASQELEAKAGK